MKNTRIGKIALVTLLLASMLLSCGGGASEETAASTDTAAAETVEVVETEYPAPDFGGADFGGDTVTVLAPEWSIYKRYFPEELTGDAVVDANFERISNTEEMLNVDIVWSPSTDSQAHNELKNAVVAGDDAYSFMLTHSIYGISDMVTENLLFNLDELPYLDFDAPWWDKSMIDNFRIGSETYYGYGDIILSNPSAVLFNKSIAEDYSLEDHYERVKNGTWTMDVFLTEIEMVSVDLNGDGAIGDEDQVGFTGDMTEALCNIPFAAGIQLTTADENGLHLNFWSEKMLDIFDRYYATMMNKNVSQGYFRSIERKQSFSQGTALFTIDSPSSMDSLRDYDIEFGILPQPKYDENQDRYYCYSWPTFVCVPTTIQNMDMVGATLEQFSYESMAVTDAYIEVLIRGKSTRDEESLEMLDIIYDSQCCDIGGSYLGFDQNFHKVFYCFLNLMSVGDNNVASHYQKYEKAILDVMDKLYTTITENQQK